MQYGCELPWRVKTIVLTESRKPSKPASIGCVDMRGKKRSGKKRRIAVREKITSRNHLDAVTRQMQQEKEFSEKEKRARKNREKKVKKREKDKMKKALKAIEGDGES